MSIELDDLLKKLKEKNPGESLLDDLQNSLNKQAKHGEQASQSITELSDKVHQLMDQPDSDANHLNNDKQDGMFLTLYKALTACCPVDLSHAADSLFKKRA